MPLYVVGAVAQRGLDRSEGVDCWFAGAYRRVSAARAAQSRVLKAHPFVNTQVWALRDWLHDGQPEANAWPHGCIGTKMRWHRTEDWDDQASLEGESDASVDASTDTGEDEPPEGQEEDTEDEYTEDSYDSHEGEDEKREDSRAPVTKVVVGRHVRDARNRHWEWVPAGLFDNVQQALEAVADDATAFVLAVDAPELASRDKWEPVSFELSRLRAQKLEEERALQAAAEAKARRESEERRDLVVRARRAYEDWVVGDERRDWAAADSAKAALLDSVVCLAEDARAWPGIQEDQYWREKKAHFVRRVRAFVSQLSSSADAPPEPFVANMKKHFYKLRPGNQP